MDLSVIIVTYNSERFIGPCLASLRRNCDTLRTELIVVDNGSTDGTLASVRAAWRDATIIQNQTNLGFAAANNQGARAVSGAYLLLLNADTVLLDQNLKRAIEYARQTGASVLGPKIVGGDGILQHTWDTSNTVGKYLRDILTLATFSKRFGLAKWLPLTEPTRVGFLVGAALLIPRAAYEKHGLFDERFFFCCEERDLCLRYIQAGEQVLYFPQWLICHYGGGGEPLSRFHLENWIRASIMFVDKHGSVSQRTLIRPLFLLFLLSYTCVFLAKAVFLTNRNYLRAAKVHASVLLWVAFLRCAPPSALGNAAH